jgi:hypothetical protein
MLLNELILKNFYKKKLINIIQKFLQNDKIQKKKNSSNIILLKERILIQLKIN